MSTRSPWAWGHAERFPSLSERADLALQLEAFLGFPSLGASDPAPPRVPEARLAIPAPLAPFSSAEPIDRARHCYGRSFPDLLRGFQGDFQAAPDLIARPHNDEEVALVLQTAREVGAAVVPYGGGSSVVGGIECAGEGYSGVICLDLERLNRVLEVDRSSLSARIQAGALGPSIEAQLAPLDLTLRHFPQSFEFSTLGGWIATRAGGHFATLYTHIDDLVQSVRMLTPTGTWQSRRLPASGAGPSPDRLVLGSEGSLGVITEAWMRVRPRPAFRASATISFQEWDAAVEAVRQLSQSGLNPANCRLLDRREAYLHRVSFDGDCLLLLAFESPGLPQSFLLEEAIGIATALDGRVKDGPHESRRISGETTKEGSAEVWKKAFLDAPYLFSSLVSMGLVVDTFETACTWDRFPSFHANIVRAVRDQMKEQCGTGLISCRFTHVYPDGPAPYYTFIAPGRPGEQLQQWRAIKQAASEAIYTNGGTITHHHAVGRMHRSVYDRERPEPFARALHAAKQELDPGWILNPGVLIDRRKQEG